MKPIIAIVGRPNVGKSTLFNKLTRSRDALVADQPGMTRDRKYGDGRLGDKPYIVVDTGGLDFDEGNISELITEQALVAADEADTIMMLVDGRHGISTDDEVIARRLRTLGKPVLLVVNKTEGLDRDLVSAEFHSLGLGQPVCVSSAHGEGLHDLVDLLMEDFPDAVETEDIRGIIVSVLGRPNVGKSTLVNRITGSERVLAYDQAGTTRDSITVPFSRDGKDYKLIDTAGIRRRGKVHQVEEKFSIIKAIQAIESSNVVLLVLDASEAITDQDATLLGMIIESGRALLIAVNKWDGLDEEQRDKVRKQLDRKLRFADYARIHFISALHGSGVGELFGSINKAHRSAYVDVSTSRMTRIIQDAVTAHQPPMVQGRRIKLRYAHIGGHNPPRVIVHGNQTNSLPDSYLRYLEKQVREALKLEGTPVIIQCKEGDNPFKGRKKPAPEGKSAMRKKLEKRHKLK